LLYANTVIVATEHDSLYGLDATTGQVRWHTNVGQPVPQSELPCGDIDPSGITSTPVIDTTTGLVWAVAFVEPHRHELIALDATTGALRSRRAVDGTGSDPTVQQQRSALALSRGRIYVAYGGLYGDCGQYHGWVVAAPVNGGPLLSWQVPSGREAGIWAPGGPTIDSSGDLFVTTGNSASSSRYDDGNSVIRLSPDLVPQDSFAPTDWVVMNATDGDLGSTSPALVGPGLVFQVGKTGTGYLLRAGHLGGVGGQLFSGPVCGSGGGAYGATAWVSPILYVPCTDGLVALRINASSFQVVWHGPSGSAGPPSVTGATVWTVAGGSDQLVALDAATGTRQASYPTGGVPHFASLGVGGGRILIPSGASIEAFGA
jgi:outer membrane protein assembly factor BamB